MNQINFEICFHPSDRTSQLQQIKRKKKNTFLKIFSIISKWIKCKKKKNKLKEM